MKLTKFTIAAAALAATAILTTSARAQVFPNINSGDLLIGFEQSGNASDYVVDLGQASTFADATSPLQINLSTADLSSVFTSSWASNSNGATNVQWGVVGNDQSASDSSSVDTVWFTQAETTPGTQSTAPTRGNTSALSAVSNKIQELESGAAANALENLEATSNTAGNFNTTTGDSTGVGVIQTSGNSESWTSFSPGVYSGGNAFGSGKNIEQLGTGNYTGPTDSVLDLYEDVPTATNGESADFLGTLSLNSSGVLTFDPAAVPEPSAYALGLTAVLMFLVLKRRKALAQD